MWPILVQVSHPEYNCKPFLAGMFYGDSKPLQADEFLEDFVKEYAELLQKGIEINNAIRRVEISAFVCEKPARAFIKCSKGHTGFYSCERCEVQGLRVQQGLRKNSLTSTMIWKLSLIFFTCLFLFD